MIPLLLCSAIAAPLLNDVGSAHLDDTPIALIVVTPGWSARALEPLQVALEARGLDAWTMEFPVDSQSADDIVHDWIPAQTRRFAARGVVLVGHGLGGTLAAMAVAEGGARPDALALLGAPLHFIPVASTAWLARQPIPPLGVDLGTELRWNGLSVATLLLGEPVPQLERVSAPWLHTLDEWLEQRRTVDLSDVSVPTWIGVGALDNLAPPETTRGPGFGAPHATFVRFGYLRMDPHGYDHIALLRQPTPTRVLARWAARNAEP